MVKSSASHRNPIKAIRRHCLDCCGGSTRAVAECPSATCALFPFRMGKNPFRAPPSEKQKIGASENFSRVRAGSESKERKMRAGEKAAVIFQEPTPEMFCTRSCNPLNKRRRDG